MHILWSSQHIASQTFLMPGALSDEIGPWISGSWQGEHLSGSCAKPSTVSAWLGNTCVEAGSNSLSVLPDNAGVSGTCTTAAVCERSGKQTAEGIMLTWSASHQVLCNDRKACGIFNLNLDVREVVLPVFEVRLPFRKVFPFLILAIRYDLIF